jgi:serine/threonine-protein kinase
MSAEPMPPSREQRLNAIVAAYLLAAESGQPPDAQELLAQHPDLAGDLQAFLADHARMRQGVAPLRSAEPVHADTVSVLPSNGSAPTVPLGKVRYFGDYELLEEIARGGMGVIFKARQVSLQRLVALKMILAGQLASEAEVQRFQIEAEAAAGLDHPNIVPIYEVGTHQGQHYFSMKLIEGGSLAELRKNVAGQALLRTVVNIVIAVARAVHHAHQRGILHRDLKPSNILLDGDGVPHVTDFGLARRVSRDQSVTESGAIVGTPGYMAPEQAAGKKELTVAVDVYGLGAVLYALLTGRPPFEAETPFDTLLKVLEKEPERPRTLNPAIDVDLETICLKCLEKEPLRRYESAAALADDLERWREGRPIQARASGALERAVKWARRQPTITALWGIIVVLSLAGVASLLAGRALALLVVIALVWLGTLFLFLKRQRQLRDAEAAARQAKPGSLSLPLRARIIHGALLGFLPGGVLGPHLLFIAQRGHLPHNLLAVHSLTDEALAAGTLVGSVCGMCGGAMVAFLGGGRRLVFGFSLALTSTFSLSSTQSARDRVLFPFLPWLALLCLVSLVGILLGGLLTRGARKGGKVPFLVGLPHFVGRCVGLLGLFYVPLLLGGELGLLLGGGGVGRAVAELAGCFLGIAFGSAALIGPLEPRATDSAARPPFAERAALRQPWEVLTLLAVLAAMVLTPFWLDWRDGRPAVPLEGYSLKGPVRALALAPDGLAVFAGSDEGIVQLWRWASPDGR